MFQYFGHINVILQIIFIRLADRRQYCSPFSARLSCADTAVVYVSLRFLVVRFYSAYYVVHSIFDYFRFLRTSDDDYKWLFIFLVYLLYVYLLVKLLLYKR